MGVTRFGLLRETEARATARSLSTFIPASACNFSTGTWTQTRGAAGDIDVRKTPAAQTSHIGVPINIGLLESAYTIDLTKGEVALGPRINSLVPVYRLLTSDATSLTPTLQTTVFTDGAAIAITDRPITGTLGVTAHATNINADTLTVTTPIVLDNTMYCTLEIVLVAAAGTDFRFHGCRVNYDLLI